MSLWILLCRFRCGIFHALGALHPTILYHGDLDSCSYLGDRQLAGVEYCFGLSMANHPFQRAKTRTYGSCNLVALPACPLHAMCDQNIHPIHRSLHLTIACLIARSNQVISKGKSPSAVTRILK